MYRAHTTAACMTAIREPRPPLTMPSLDLAPNPFAAGPPPRNSHEGVLFLDDSVVVPRSAFEVDDAHSEGGSSLPGLEGPRPPGAVRHRITRAGTTPPVALEDWDAVKPPPRAPAPPEQAAAPRGWTQGAEHDSPFIAADGPDRGAPLFPETGSAVEGLVEQPSWVDGRPSASALLSPFVASAQSALHRLSTADE